METNMLSKLPVIAAAVLFSVNATAQVGRSQGLTDPNLAERSELIALPGVTEANADVIVNHRPVLGMSDLDDVLSELLDEPQRQSLYAKLFRQINLNQTTREEIMLIPGMTTRMAHEFEEYRPYANMEQFRREIGKYVDNDEVARLESYVTLD